MLSYKYDLSLTEQTNLDTLIADEDMTNKVVLYVNEEFEIVNKELFDKMNYQVLEFDEDAGEIISDSCCCE